VPDRSATAPADRSHGGRGDRNNLSLRAGDERPYGQVHGQINPRAVEGDPAHSADICDACGWPRTQGCRCRAQLPLWEGFESPPSPTTDADYRAANPAAAYVEVNPGETCRGGAVAGKAPMRRVTNVSDDSPEQQPSHPQQQSPRKLLNDQEGEIKAAFKEDYSGDKADRKFRFASVMSLIDVVTTRLTAFDTTRLERDHLEHEIRSLAAIPDVPERVWRIQQLAGAPGPRLLLPHTSDDDSSEGW
jgi:hypothetical protein